MIVWNLLPDTLAFAAVVAVFVSLIRLQHELSGKWIAGWILILVHFGCNLINVGDSNVPLDLAATWSLELAGFAFMWAAVSRRADVRSLTAFGIFALPVLFVSLLLDVNVAAKQPYVLTTIAGALAGAAVVATVGTASRGDRLRSILLILAVAVSLLIDLAIDNDRSDLLNMDLTWEYVIAGALYWRRFPRSTTGTLTTVFGFLAWALVFPVGWMQSDLFPKVVIDAADWNIPKYIVAIGIIVTLLEQQMERSRYLAEHDELTGLPNRRLLETRLQSLVAPARARLALVTIDLDRFKQVNDTLGHDAGDAMLRVLADRFTRLIGERDICARFGGDEFVIVAADIRDRTQAADLVRRLNDALRETIHLGGAIVSPSASIGVALYPEDARDLPTLFTRSDRDMYDVKLQRRSA